MLLDNGRGISVDFLPLVFQMFRQGEPGTARRQGGLGIGLALVKHIAELHGGSVSVTLPGVDQGTTFEVQLPVAAA